MVSFGTTLGILFLIVKSLLSGIIYTKTAFQRLIPYKYLFSLNFETSDKNYESTKPALELIAKTQKDHKIGFLFLTKN